MSSHPLIPGANAVGFGFNITQKYDISSITTRVVSGGDLSPNTFPGPGGQVYSYPANVLPIPDSTTSATSYVTQSQSDFQKTFATSVSAGVSAGVFSGEFDFAYSNTFDSSSSYYYCWLNAYFRAFSLTLNEVSPSNLDPGFADDLGQLPDKFNDDTSAVFFDFLNKYGTHYVSAVNCGAMMRYYLAVKTAFSSDDTAIHTNVQLEYKAVFVDTSLNASADWNTLTQTWALSRTVNIYAVGGDNSLVSLIDPTFGENFSVQFQQWVTSMQTNPAIMDFKLQPLSILCGDKSHAVSAAIDSYANGVLLVSADIEYPPTGVTASFNTSMAGETILPSPNTPMPLPPSLPSGRDVLPPSGFQVSVFDSDTLDTLLSKVYYFAEPWPPHTFDVYAAMTADIAKLPDTNYLAAVVGFGINQVGNFPPKAVANWLADCGATLDGWRACIASSASDGFLNYLFIGSKGTAQGDATERFAVGNDYSPGIGLTTSISYLLYADNGS